MIIRPAIGLLLQKRSRQFSLVLACCLLLPIVAAEEPIKLDPLLEQVEQQRIDAIARATPSAVSVFVPGGGGGGSGVLISPDGYALTNFHVTSPAGAFMRCGLSDGNIYDAVIVGIDPVGDLAMIRLLGRDDFPAAELGDSRTAEAGDWSMVIGNPFLLASNLQPTVTWGILSGVGRYQYPSGTLLEYGDCLQTDASINPGNSGGPIYDAQGRLLGIVGRASFEKRGRVNVGVGYAISINQAKNFLGYSAERTDRRSRNAGRDRGDRPRWRCQRHEHLGIKRRVPPRSPVLGGSPGNRRPSRPDGQRCAKCFGNTAEWMASQADVPTRRRNQEHARAADECPSGRRTAGENGWRTSAATAAEARKGRGSRKAKKERTPRQKSTRSIPRRLRINWSSERAMRTTTSTWFSKIGSSLRFATSFPAANRMKRLPG